MPAKRFDEKTLQAIGKSLVLGIRAGARPHRVIGIWAVVVEGRVFVRSWTIKPDGWYETFNRDRSGIVEIGGKKIPIRAVKTRSQRLKDAVDRAYATKYHTPASRKYVRGFRTPRRKETTTELVPA
ncbi:MAG TPA: DUF2255 family protein [Thermoanaerobaculia bacterium]|nr:DUF2255 family protein [Thermoanaerobaculia bacterium]